LLHDPSVLIIVQNLPVPFDRRVWQEAVSLRRAGYGVAVVCPKRAPFTASFERLEAVDIYRYPLPFEGNTGVLAYLLEFVYCWLASLVLALKAYRHRRFQAIHGCNPPDTFFALAMLFRPFGVKFVFDHHDLCPEMYVAKGRPRRGPLYRGLLLLERLTFRSADAVIAVNQSHRDIAVRRGSLAADKVTIVRSGPRLEWSENQVSCPGLKRGRRFLVVYLGEMGTQDGIDHLLQVVRNYAESYQKDTLFTLIGGGPEQQHMKEIAHEMGLDDWINFTGRVTDDRILREHLATADLCIAPDPFTEYGDLSTTNKIIEYLALGRPVVAFDLTEHRRTAEETAVYVEPNNDGKLSATTRELLLDEARRHEMGRQGRQRFRALLAWENSERELLALYSKLLGSADRERGASALPPDIRAIRRAPGREMPEGA
jgi:glycosyltransferase involved in cell wall biosynthesis